MVTVFFDRNMVRLKKLVLKIQKYNVRFKNYFVKVLEIKKFH